MSDAISEKNISQLKVGRVLEDDSPFCLAGLSRYESEDPELQEKSTELLEGRVTNRDGIDVERACNLGGCTLKLTDSVASGRKISGACKAASYCLKTTFTAVGEAQTVEEGKALYADIVDNLHGFTSQYSAGNFCPKLSCGLSAGVSIDMVPGTAGECVKPIDEAQELLDFELSD